MNTLLKDLPEHKERIENNYHLEQDIRKIIWTNRNNETDRTAKLVLEELANFVNENYEWKGIKA